MALFFGILHALEPGHGKTAIVTYILSGKKTWIDGVIISTFSVLSHTFVVFMMALSMHYLIHHKYSDHVISNTTNLLSITSGLIIITIGLYLILKNFYRHKQQKNCSCSNLFYQEKPNNQKNRFLVSGILGIATGIIPCPTIVAAYASGISSGNSLLGLQSIIMFSLGMFFSMITAITIVSFSGAKIGRTQHIKNSYFSIVFTNWHILQGLMLVIIGCITCFYH